MPQLSDPRREKFCQEYLIDMCLAKAARRAGYSDKSASRIGWTVMQNADVQARIDELKAERADRTQARQDRVIEELMAVAFADMSDFADWGPDGFKLRSSDELTPQQTAAVLEVSETVSRLGVTRSIKLQPKMRALIELARQLGMKSETLEVQHTGSVIFMPPTAPPAPEKESSEETDD